MWKNRSVKQAYLLADDTWSCIALHGLWGGRAYLWCRGEVASYVGAFSNAEVAVADCSILQTGGCMAQWQGRCSTLYRSHSTVVCGNTLANWQAPITSGWAYFKTAGVCRRTLFGKLLCLWLSRLIGTHANLLTSNAETSLQSLLLQISCNCREESSAILRLCCLWD